MKKVYIEAEYRIPGKSWSNGYICICKDSINGIFSLDFVTIEIIGNTLHFYLEEFNPAIFGQNSPEEFVCRIWSDTLESPNVYLFNSTIYKNKKLELRLIKRISDLNSISNIIDDFNTFF